MRTLIRLVATMAASWVGYFAAEEVAVYMAGTALAALAWGIVRGWTAAPSIPITPRLRPPGGSWAVLERQPRRIRPCSPALAQDVALLRSVGLVAEDGR